MSYCTTNKSATSWQRDTDRICSWAPAVQQSTNIFCPPGPQQQTRCSGVRRPNDETDRRDGQAPGRFIDPATHTIRAVSIDRPILYTAQEVLIILALILYTLITAKTLSSGGRAHEVDKSSEASVSSLLTTAIGPSCTAGWELPNLKWGVRVATTYD